MGERRAVGWVTKIVHVSFARRVLGAQVLGKGPRPGLPGHLECLKATSAVQIHSSFGGVGRGAVINVVQWAL